MSSTQVLIYSQRPEVQEVLETELKELTGFRPLIKESIEDFRLMFDLLVRVDMIVIDAPRSEIFNSKILPFLEQRIDCVKNILILTDEFVMMKKSDVFTYEKFELLMECMRKTLSLHVESIEEYVSIPIETIVHFNVLPFDIYIKISKNKFVKRIIACEEIDKTIIHNLRSKGVYELYFDKRYNKDFSRMLLNNMMNGVEKEYESYSEKLEVKNDVFMTTKEIVLSLGLAPRVISLCESVMSSIMTDIMEGKNQFSAFLNQLAKSKLSFHYRYIELTSYIATQIIDDYEPFASSNFAKRVIFSAFFCDVTLKRPEWIHIRNEAQLLGLPDEIVKEINMHALRASELILNYQNAPMGAHRIIRQHHGSLNGLGFSSAHYDKLCPLTKCLISSQEIAYAILTSSEEDVRVTVSDIVKKHQGTSLQEMFDRFERKCRPHLAAKTA